MLKNVQQKGSRDRVAIDPVTCYARVGPERRTPLYSQKPNGERNRVSILVPIPSKSVLRRTVTVLPAHRLRPVRAPRLRRNTGTLLPGLVIGTSVQSSFGHVSPSCGPQANRHLPMPTKPVSTPGARKRAKPSSPQVKFRMRVMIADVIAVGPGKISLLEAIGEHGSISAAARSMEMSYRRAWLLVQEVNKAMRSPAVVSDHGGETRGGTKLTPEGESIVRLYRQIERTASAACKTDIDTLLELLE